MEWTGLEHRDRTEDGVDSAVAAALAVFDVSQLHCWPGIVCFLVALQMYLFFLV